MKATHELMSKLDQIARRNGNGYNNDILKEIQEFEVDIRKDQATDTAINVFAYIVDNGEDIPEEICLQMCNDFINSEKYNKIK